MKNILRTITAAAFMCSFIPVTRAQAPTAANPLAQVTKVMVHPSGVTDFEDFVKKIQAGRTKNGMTGPMYVFQTMLGGSPYEYHVLTPANDWAAVDAMPSVTATLMKAYGDVEGARILKAGRSAIDTVSMEVYTLRLDLSTNVKAGAEPMPLTRLTITELNPAAVAGYSRILAKIKKAEEMDPSAPTVLRYALNLGVGAVAVAARPVASLAGGGPDQGEMMRKAFGNEEWRLMSEEIARGIVKRSSVVLAYRPDLSSTARPAAAK